MRRWLLSKLVMGNAGVLLWLDENGSMIELGPVSREEFKLLARLTQEVHQRQAASGTSSAALARLRGLTAGWWHAIKSREKI